MSDLNNTFSFGPLNPGFGQTLGQALRRILLSSIEGLGLVGIKIDGVNNRFSSISGVLEDVEGIIINSKKIIFKSDLSEFVANVNVSGPCVVTAGMLDEIPGVEILNPDQYICTLSDSSEISMKLAVKVGKGYVSHKEIEISDDFIALDVAFNPVTRVSYKSTDTRVGQKTDFNQLELTIDTNGSLDSKDALSQASKILESSAKIFNSDEAVEEIVVQDEKYVDDRLFELVSSLGLTKRAKGAVDALELVYVGDLVSITEKKLLSTPRCGAQTLQEIKAVLESNYGFSLGTEIEEWSEVRPKDMVS